MTPDPVLRQLWALSWLDAFARQCPQETRSEPVRLDDPGRPPLVRLRPAGGGRG